LALSPLSSALTTTFITQAQYSFLVGTVIASAVIPMIIANALFLPRHLLPNTHLYAVKTVEHSAQKGTAADEA
jgi:glutathione-regulated potassium-efflux system ancillary protein KefC